MRVRLECITMSGNEFVLWERDGGPEFPHGELKDGEQPAEAVRALVRGWSGTDLPKLELVDLATEGDALVLLFRALLVAPPQGSVKRVARGELAGRFGNLEGKAVEEALKTSLPYKLTRP